MNGNLKDKTHEGEDQTQFGKTDREIGKELAEKKTHGSNRRDEQLFECAAFLLADDGEGGEERGDVQQENSRGTGVRIEQHFGAHIDGKGGPILQNAAERFVEADGGRDVDGLAGDRGVRAVDENENLGAHTVEEAVRII